MNIREILNFDAPYYSINREERSLAAIFYHALLINNNLKGFLNKLNFPVVEEEMAVYFEYSFLRDLWFSIDKSDNQTKRKTILSLLEPENSAYLQNCSVYDFNSWFGAVPVPSRDYIQSPGNWSVDKYKLNIHDNQEFLKVCKFKWCFNAKPDIVIHTSNNHAICIEGKFESGEGTYPSKESEKREFEIRGLPFVKQTEIQEKIMELLGVEAIFFFLVKDEIYSSSHKIMHWNDAFDMLDLSGSPLFIQKWVQRLKKPHVNPIPDPSNVRSKMHRPYFQNRIAPEYSNRLHRIKDTFPSGYNFMKYPEENDTHLWLSTSVNAHLYFSDYYLAYIKIEGNDLIFSPKYNNKIDERTKDMSGLLFSGQIQGLIKLYHGFDEGWAQQRGETITFKTSTPEKFFKSLIKYIDKL